MWYEIGYIIRTTQHEDSLCGKSNLFPVLEISYRKKDSEMWVCTGDVEIDLYAYRRFKNIYYKDFERNAKNIAALESMTDYERLTLFLHILEVEFDCSMDRFVESVVREEIVMNNAGDEERKEVNRLALSLVTDGWRMTNVKI